MRIILVLRGQKDSQLKYTAFVCLLSSRLFFFSVAVLILFASYIKMVALKYLTVKSLSKITEILYPPLCIQNCYFDFYTRLIYSSIAVSLNSEVLTCPYSF